jgi:hypothetical protein
MRSHLHLMPSLRMRGTISPLHQYVFMAWYLKYRHNFTFIFTFTSTKFRVTFDASFSQIARSVRIIGRICLSVRMYNLQNHLIDSDAVLYRVR